jgi:RNA-directed DNA polymerase
MSKLSIKRNLAWNDLKWGAISMRVKRIQRRIYKAEKSGDSKRVTWLQKLLLNSLDAKLLAVHQVTTLNKGRNTAGVDRKTITTSKQKLNVATNLDLDGKAKPIRRVWIPKPGKMEKRPLGIPTIKDRSKQALAKLALEPQWEAKFEFNSFGFRPGRSAQDAIEAIFLSLRHGKPKWVFDADIRKCFDRINHEALLAKLNTFPEMENQIRAWLKANIMEGYANNPKEVVASTMGTPQGGIISPLLANIALHGLENNLKDLVANLEDKVPGMARGSLPKRKALSVVRYADDFVIIHQDKYVIQKCIEYTHSWLEHLGLEISEEKSKLRIGTEGFLFLGFQIIQVRKQGDYKVKIRPSSESQKRLLEKVRSILQRLKAASSYDVIKALRPVILGWANYFKYSECSVDFLRLTHSIFLKVRAWVFRRDTRNGRLVIKEKYFPTNKTYNFDESEHKDNWILNGRKASKGTVDTNYLPHVHWVKSRKHVKIQGDKSPYDGDHVYWAERSEKYSILPTRTQTLLRTQKFKCNWCEQKFTTFDQL